jgi:hypothetical protein
MPQCAFCLQHGKMSAEHIWSAWICELFPDIEVTFRQWSVTDAVQKEWDAPMGLTTKVVCKACNEGWMSDLESGHAKPAMKSLILSGDPVILDTARLVSIAIFAFKTAVIGNHMGRDQLPFFPSQVRRRFANTLRIPPGFQVWMGRLADSDPHHGVFRQRYWKTPTGTTNGYHLYGVTWGIGRFVFQATATRWTSGRNRRNVLPHLTQDSYFDSFSIPIWPMLNGPITAEWPPRHHLGHDVLYQFCDRWKEIVMGRTWTV